LSLANAGESYPLSLLLQGLGALAAIGMNFGAKEGGLAADTQTAVGLQE